MSIDYVYKTSSEDSYRIIVGIGQKDGRRKTIYAAEDALHRVMYFWTPERGHALRTRNRRKTATRTSKDSTLFWAYPWCILREDARSDAILAVFARDRIGWLNSRSDSLPGTDQYFDPRYTMEDWSWVIDDTFDRYPEKAFYNIWVDVELLMIWEKRHKTDTPTNSRTMSSYSFFKGIRILREREHFQPFAQSYRLGEVDVDWECEDFQQDCDKLLDCRPPKSVMREAAVYVSSCELDRTDLCFDCIPVFCRLAAESWSYGLQLEGRAGEI